MRTDGTRRDEQGLTRFEVSAREPDRELICALARRLLENDPEAAALRVMLRGALSDAGPRGVLLAALRRSPLVGAGLDLSRADD